MNIRLPEHYHCINCDNPMPTDEEFCSEKCLQEKEAGEKRARRQTMFFYAIAIVALIALWVWSYVL